MSTAPTKAKRLRIRRTPEQWRDLFDLFKRSGQMRGQFCREQGMSVSSFDRWRAKLRKRTPEQPTVSTASLFTELTPDIQSPAAPAWDVELQLGSGVFLRLRRPC